MEQDVAIDGESELKENRSLSLLVKAEKKSRHKKYSHGTVESMSTVTQDLHGSRLALSAANTRRSDIGSNVECESDLKKNRCCSCLWSQRNNSVHKNYCYGTVGLLSICKTHTLTAFAPHWQVHAKTRCGLGRSAVHGWPAAMQAMHRARLHSRLNSWDWVLVQVHPASSVPLRATIRMPTTIAISRKRSCTISIDKTVVVARMLGACAVFFLVIATTTRLLWASFGATLDQLADVPKPFRPFSFTFLKDCSLICVKEILDFWSYAWNTQEEGGEQGAFCKFMQASV